MSALNEYCKEVEQLMKTRGTLLFGSNSEVDIWTKVGKPPWGKISRCISAAKHLNGVNDYTLPLWRCKPIYGQIRLMRHVSD